MVYYCCCWFSFAVLNFSEVGCIVSLLMLAFLFSEGEGKLLSKMED